MTLETGTVNGLPVFRAPRNVLVKVKMRLGKPLTDRDRSPWTVGIPPWFLQPIKLREAERLCPTCQAGAEWPEDVPYCPRCKGSLKLRQCEEHGCETWAPTGAHEMETHGLCFTHSPDCTGVCHP